MSLHTEGPWELIAPEESDGKGNRFYIIRANDATIAAVYPTGNGKETKANALLLSAAYEMDTALKAIRAMIDVRKDIAEKAEQVFLILDKLAEQALSSASPGRAIQPAAEPQTPPTEAKS